MEKPIYHLEQLLRGKSEAAEDFVGPLDLILHLLSKNKIEIRDIPVSQILDQYLDWMSTRQKQDLEIASEFIAMAAHLLYIKTRMLLSVKDEELESEMEQLMQALERRRQEEIAQRIRLIQPELAQMFARGSAQYATPPKRLDTGPRVWDYHHKSTELAQAWSRMVERSRSKLPPKIAAFRGLLGREPYPIAHKAQELRIRLLAGENLSLYTLLAESQSRSELVAVFIVVLELCGKGALHLGESEELALHAGAQLENGAKGDAHAVDASTRTD